MKLKKKPLWKEYYAIDVYQDDLKRVYDLFYKVKPEVVIETDAYEFSNWKEFTEHVDATKTVRMRISDYYKDTFSLEFVVDKSSITVSASGDRANDLFTRLDLILSPLQKWHIPATANTVMLFMISGLLVLASLFYDIPFLSKEVNDVLQWLLTITAWIFVVYLRRKPILYLKKPREHESFWNKNRNAIIVGVIIAILTKGLDLVIDLYN